MPDSPSSKTPVYAALVGNNWLGPFQSLGNALPWFHGETTLAQIASALLFFGLAVVTARAAQKKIM